MPHRCLRGTAAGARAWLLPLLLAVSLLTGTAAAHAYLGRADVRAFVDVAVARHALDRAWLERALSRARYSADAERLSTPALAPAWTRNWLEYRTRIIDERRIREGVEFYRLHQETLNRAATDFGVPASVIVAIIGVETQYGRVIGSHRTLDALMTLSFDYTRRAPLFREQLLQFLLLCHEQKIDPLAPRGSFAGAIGLPQFMPGSIRSYAIDFDGDGRIDITDSVADAIGSVARFLVAHGWQRDLPVLLPAQSDAGVVDVLGRGIAASYRWRDVAALGVRIQASLDADARVLLLNLPYVSAAGDEAFEYRIGTVNAAALLHYNRSYFYASSVVDLAQAIEGRLSEPANGAQPARTTASSPPPAVEEAPRR